MAPFVFGGIARSVRIFIDSHAGAAVGRSLGAGPVSVVDESADDGQSHVYGQGQRGLVFCRQSRQQLGQPVAAVAALIV
jgi:hypothetical protein